MQIVEVNIIEGSQQTQLQNLIISGNGSAVIQSNLLIGKQIFILTIDNLVRVPSDYSFNTQTGEIIFVSTIDNESVIQIIYR